MASLSMNSVFTDVFNTKTLGVDSLKSSKEELVGPLKNKVVDFVYKTKRTWMDVAKDIVRIILKIVLFPVLIIRYLTQRLIMTILYPAQSFLFKRFVTGFNTKHLDGVRNILEDITDKDTIIRHVVLEKDGTRYSGLMLTTKDTYNNGKWALQAGGNCETIEHTVQRYWNSETYSGPKFNLLMINGPGVGHSQGTATPETMGDAQNVGLHFLETAVRAQNIVIAGMSLGSAAISQAILKHEFLEDRNYTVINQMAFDKTSNIAAKHVFLPEFITKGLIRATGLEMDNVKASKKLSELKIKQVVIQSTKKMLDEKNPHEEHFRSDGVIPADASLGKALVKENITDAKEFVGLVGCGHNDDAALHATQQTLTLLNLEP